MEPKKKTVWECSDGVECESLDEARSHEVWLTHKNKMMGLLKACHGQEAGSIMKTLLDNSFDVIVALTAYRKDQPKSK